MTSEQRRALRAVVQAGQDLADFTGELLELGYVLGVDHQMIKRWNEAMVELLYLMPDLDPPKGGP